LVRIPAKYAMIKASNLELLQKQYGQAECGWFVPPGSLLLISQGGWSRAVPCRLTQFAWSAATKQRVAYNAARTNSGPLAPG